jgi:hypothetical protein
MVVPPNHPKSDHFNIETYETRGLGIPHFKKPPYIQ